MAKSPVTGAARSPSNEEFKERVARLAPSPGKPASALRSSRGKAAYKPQRSERSAEGTSGDNAAAGSGAAGDERDREN
ncbi:hypothetical protein [Methylobacterium sp. JK268]